MQDLVPEYEPRWRWLDLQYLWLWNEAMTELLPELRTDVTLLMVWIVRRRYLELMLASRACNEGGVMHYSEWWRDRRAISPLALCAALPSRDAFDRFRHEMWNDNANRVVSSSIHTGEHETMQLRVPGEVALISLIIHVVPNTAFVHLRDVTLEIQDDTLWCSYTVRGESYQRRRPGLGVSTPYRVPLMQL